MQPEHFDLSTPVFLPITDETCAKLLVSNGTETLVDLTVPELAAVLVIQNLAQTTETDHSADTAEKILAKLIAWAVDAQHTTAVGLLSEAQRLFDMGKLSLGLKSIRKLNLRFLLDEEVSAREYLLPSQKWDFEFKVRHHRGNNPFSEQVVTPRHRERWLSAAQDNLVRTFSANLDEHLHVQGYAGIGKSHLLGALMEYLKPERTLLLARTFEKLETIRRRMKSSRDKQAGQTFSNFAHFLLHGRKPHPVINPVRVPSKQILSHELNILGFKHHDAQATFDICLEVIELYCRSRDYSLSNRHLPTFKQPLTSLDAKVLLEYSSRVWNYLYANPAWGNQVDFEALLKIKLASLAGCVVPARYTHIFIDESQDIPESLLQIIERGGQRLITLGDEYQQVSSATVRRKSEVRHSDVSYSVRSGRNVEHLVNTLIARHSMKSKVLFEGSRNADVVIEYYPQNFLPSGDCVVLTASLWDTMKWVIQLHDGNCAFSFSSKKYQRDFERFMLTAIELFRPNYYSAHGSVDPHSYFSDMPDWQRVREVCQFDESFLWVEAELEKGFRVADMTRLKSLIGPPGKSCVLMMAKDAGGMEFDHVLLTTELLTNVKFKDAYEFDERLCAVYIAVSRAKQQLYLPYDVVEWVEYHDYQKYRETPGY
ncbi:AAA family ATPase [Pseudomonas syringae]|nr:AAA family ATPase [Pseudomonas syringae]